MKIEVKEKSKETKPLKFPVLMKSKHTGEIVLFVSKHEGIALIDEYSKSECYYSELWDFADNDSDWEKLEGSVILSND